MIKLGSMVRDKITGFVGIAIGRTTWLNGCNRWGVQGLDLHEGRPTEVVWIDSVQLAVVPDEQTPATKATGTEVGGPQQDPPPLTGG
jgi:hypothetical protein